LLVLQRDFQNFLKDLLVTYLQRLLHGAIVVGGGETGVLVPTAG
jgi:hypothetical protein